MQITENGAQFFHIVGTPPLRSGLQPLGSARRTLGSRSLRRRVLCLVMASSPGVSSAPGETTVVTPNAFSQLKFSDVCELFEAIREVNKTGYKGNEDKRRLLNQFFKAKTSTVCDGNRVGSYDLYRLLLPNIDKERSAYMLKEAALAGLFARRFLGAGRNHCCYPQRVLPVEVLRCVRALRSDSRGEQDGLQRQRG